MISGTYFTVMVLFILVMAVLNKQNRAQWYLFGIFFCLITITTVLLVYFDMWSSLLPQFLDPQLKMPSGIS